LTKMAKFLKVANLKNIVATFGGNCAGSVPACARRHRRS
jgi:hypothetical protein